MKPVLFTIALFAMAAPGACDLTRAYSFYLLGEYDSALVCYRAVERERPSDMDAYYGIMNCYVARKQYDSALVTAAAALARGKDKVIYEKCAYVNGLRNDQRNASLMYESALSLIEAEAADSASRRSDFIELIEAAGYGFYKSGNYRQALRWFRHGDSVYPGENLFAVPRSHAETALRGRWFGQSSLFGGGIGYSKNAVFANGNYEGLSGAVLFNRSLHFKMEYGRTRISLKPQYYGLTYDTLIASRGEHPDPSRVEVSDTVDYINLSGDPDTAYYTRSSSRIAGANAAGFDSVATIRSADYWQDDAYLALTDYYSLFDKTRLLAGCRLSRSNMPYSRYAYTAFAAHLSKAGPYSFGAEYYLTAVPGYYIYQVSPSVEADAGPIGATVRANLIKAESKGAGWTGIPTSLQVAPDLEVRFGGPVFKLTLTATLGKRAFCNEAQGEFLHNVTIPYREGVKSLAEWTPFKFPLTFYYLFKYAAYDGYTYNKIAYDGYTMMFNMGGIFIQW
jgi:tetratricopeptide (TPR) repeat protein